MPNRLISKAALLLFVLISLWVSSVHAGFSKHLWPKWLINNPLSTQSIDHHLWADFLDKHLNVHKNAINRMDYGAISAKDRAILAQYIHYLASLDINQYNRDEQLAYWLNLYNALTVNIIVQYYPVRSIKDINISPGLFSIGPWGARLVEIKGQALSLDDINNKIIRPIWNDPRTLYALNHGALGSPNLQALPFNGKAIHTQLNHASIEYVNALRGVQVIEGNLIVSKLYKWFFEDFGGSEKALIIHLKCFAKEPLKSQLRHVNNINSYVYNWYINATKP